jgi:hypothetical protein
MSDSMFYGEFAPKLTEPIRLGPWEFHGECRAKTQIVMGRMTGDSSCWEKVAARRNSIEIMLSIQLEHVKKRL